MADYRANYALLRFMEHLGEDANHLDVDWAEFVGDRSSERTFDVPVADPADAYLELQVYDVGEWDHEIRLNGEAVSGFDIPKEPGWQYWMDALSGTSLRAGENTLRIHRDTATMDSFVVGNVVVNWREPVEA